MAKPGEDNNSTEVNSYTVQVSGQLDVVYTHFTYSFLFNDVSIRDAIILQYIDILQYSLMQYNTIRLMKNIDILHIAIY